MSRASRSVSVQNAAAPSNAAVSDFDRLLIRCIAGAMLGLLLLMLIFGGPVVRLAGLALVACTLQGLWRGAAELAGLVAGLLVAMVLSPAIGKGLEGAVSGVFGTAGLTNRFLSIGLVALVITAGVAAGVGFAAKRYLKRSPPLQRWNPYIGGALGLVEGLVLALAVLWVPLALEPVAHGQVEQARADAEESGQPVRSPGLAGAVVGFAQSVRESSMGGLAQGTNPLQDSRLISLAGDFALVSQNEAAMRWLLDTEVMRTAHELPSVQRALEIIHEDRELMAMSEDGWVTADSIRAAMNSPTVLRVFDETSAVADLNPLADELAQAIADAKARIKRPGRR
jgi:hypothetical protein